MRPARALGALLAPLALACNPFAHHEQPDAGTPTETATVSATPTPARAADVPQGDEDNPLPVGPCPRPIHPDYCRFNCRSYTRRAADMHARRVWDPFRAGLGTCGTFKVFAEEARGPDGGAGGSIVEYFDPATESLVSVHDTLTSGCPAYGTIPTCTLAIKWGPPRRPLTPQEQMLNQLK